MYTDHRPMQQPQGLQNSNSRQQYLSMVQSKIDSHKQYPMAARRRNIQGKVGVRFVIRGDGGVHSIQITQSSGQSLLDDAAKRAVSSAAPFSRPPAQDFAGDIPFIPLELTIVFTLN
jgi:periplasmic protein TonB